MAAAKKIDEPLTTQFSRGIGGVFGGNANMDKLSKTSNKNEKKCGFQLKTKIYADLQNEKKSLFDLQKSILK